MKKKRRISISLIVCAPFLFFGALCLCASIWYIDVFGDVGFDAVLYTLFSDIEGTESGIVYDFILKAVLPAAGITAALLFFLFVNPKRKLFMQVGEKVKLRLYPFRKWFSIAVSVALTAGFVLSAAVRVDFVRYYSYMTQESTAFIEEHYVDPAAANITFPQEKRNLIILYLESMETSFTDAEYGGGNDVNPIRELCELAGRNTNFSQNETVGGFSSLTGGTWTIGALVSICCGVPLKLPFDITGNSYGDGHFLPGITTMSDILHENGYVQAFVCGSQASFGGREQFYVEHGVDKIYDYNAAKEDGLIAPDYAVWWGMEDSYVFEYARQKLGEMSRGDQPFAVSILTADTHHIGGYCCDRCRDEYPERYENVLACSSRQVTEFVQWLTEQDFYENTTIVICGDHPTMDGEYAANNLPADYDRKVYNCFINAVPEAVKEKNREFSSLDMFPTILASVGCTFDGDRLGLGTNMFSSSATLSEELGRDAFDYELSRKSDFYDKAFLGLRI